MKFHGNIDLLDNQLRQAVLQQETSYPTVPKPGRMIFKDKRVLICVEINGDLPVWVPLTHELDTHVHIQSTAATSWTVTHNLNTTTPMIQVFDTNNSPVIFDNWAPIDNNSGTVTVTAADTGRAVLMYGDIFGGPKTQVSYTHTQSTSSTTWVITHNLGYNPIVRAFVGNQEVQPASIVHDSINQVTLTFSSAYTGTARLI